MCLAHSEVIKTDPDMGSRAFPDGQLPLLLIWKAVTSSWEHQGDVCPRVMDRVQATLTLPTSNACCVCVLAQATILNLPHFP